MRSIWVGRFMSLSPAGPAAPAAVLIRSSAPACLRMTPLSEFRTNTRGLMLYDRVRQIAPHAIKDINQALIVRVHFSGVLIRTKQSIPTGGTVE